MLESGLCYAGGQLGTILCGEHDNWKAIDHNLTDQDIWGLEYYADSIFFASDSAIFKITQDHQVERVDTGLGDDWTYRHLYACDKKLWSVGPRHVAWTSDTKQWHPATP
jgi:hypothetical protein